MANTSATGGYLLPISTLPPNDQELEDLLQPWLVGLTGLDGSLVRPIWQEDPPARPERNISWMAFGFKGRKRDWSHYEKHITDPDDETKSYDLTYRNQELEITCVCYGPTANALSDSIWSNVQIAQNREFLFRNWMSFISVDDPTPLAEKLKEKWLPRVDVRIHLRRAVSLRYSVLDLAGATVTVNVGDLVEEVVVDVDDE